MADSTNPRRKPRLTRRLLSSAATPRVSVLDLALLSLAAALAVALIVTMTKPVTSTTRLETTSVLDHTMTWTTLGTMSGPIPDPDRSQPANLLWNNKHAILVDAGDGAAEQIAKAGHPLSDVDSVILSHLHIDHTGGLSAIIGMRYQQHIPGTLTVYGPPGTQRLVDGLVAAQKGLVELSGAENPQITKLPSSNVAVVEITDGARLTVDGVDIAAVENSHYGFAAGTPEAKAYQSLSLRFTMPDRTIVFTGDTGPSDGVRQLAKGADLLISEITDPGTELATLKAERTDIPFVADPILKKHFEQQHLTADAVGELAAGAGLKSLVLTHNPIPAGLIPQAGVAIASHYDGPVAFADDLDNY